MYVIDIANKRTLRSSKNTFYVGRPNALGNPFVIGKDGTRQEVIQKYSDYFETCLKDKNKRKFHAELCEIKRHLKKHGRVILVCWCYPSACHASIIRAYLLKSLGIQSNTKSSRKSLF